MTLSWNEIKARAAAFVAEWRDKAPIAREEADAQTFENGFLSIFGIMRSQIAVFEKKVKLHDGSNGYIDLLWKGHLLIEMKSPGKDRLQAYKQAKTYANALSAFDLPRGILICDFVNFDYYNLANDAELTSFTLNELVEKIETFSDLAGYYDLEIKRQESVNIPAAEKMGRLHDQLEAVGYTGHRLELYLVRLLFCLFADDTGIFTEKNLFQKYIEQRTSTDGSDLALHIQKIFETLNKPQSERLKTLDEQLSRFPFINGGLFTERLESADFDARMRQTLLDCCALDWGTISPAIFGAMFQSVMNSDERHDLGAHYTSEENILKVIQPLFMNSLWTEFEQIKTKGTGTKKLSALQQFHNKIASLRFLDPACGCGNFLVISYRELRILELEVITTLYGSQQTFDVSNYIKVNVNQFYGIEIEEFPCQIAQTAMWLIDHQMNLQVSARFGQYFVRIPLTTAPTIVHGNALTLNWDTLREHKVGYIITDNLNYQILSEPQAVYHTLNVVTKRANELEAGSVFPESEPEHIDYDYIMGNPPFLGARVMSKSQKAELESVFKFGERPMMRKIGELDYVTCWYRKAAVYLGNHPNTQCAFVSTNSICQGTQVPVLWRHLMDDCGLKINFAHQTFKWTNEARGKAAVYCVIVGFAKFDRDEKYIYTYEDIRGKAKKISVSRINPYLIDSETVFIESRNKPICDVPEIVYGNMPIDGGFLLLTSEEREMFISQESITEKYIKPLISAKEFLNGGKRWCLWLKDANPRDIRSSRLIYRRLQQVKDFRESSARKVTRELASTPSLFAFISQPDNDYILIPRVSSENRRYIPIGFFDKDSIVGDTCMMIPNANVYHFGILTSTMHMAWMRYVCGRLKSDYRYSASIVYNNFPWPNTSEKQRETIIEKAEKVFNIREKYINNTLADLYDTTSMPKELLQAHIELDKAVERAYGKTFSNDAERVAFLFGRYRELTKDLFTKATGKGKKGMA